MKILVTGGAGFIGSHLIRELCKKKHEVIVVDNLSTGMATNIPKEIQLINLDINSNELEKVFFQENFDAVIHLAGQTMVNVSIDDPQNDMKQNIHGTIHILELVRKYNVKRIIFSSTAAVYGDINKLPIKENDFLAPTSFYGLSKLCVEKYFDMYHKIFDIDYVILRFANVYGERQGDGGEGGVISIFAKKLAKNQEITIFGNGMQTRDYIYVGDIVDGIYAALKTENFNTVYNLSTQSEHSLLEIVKYFEKYLGKNIMPNYEKARDGDIFRSMLSNEKAQHYLEWSPKVNLEKGLINTLRYFQDKYEYKRRKTECIII